MKQSRRVPAPARRLLPNAAVALALFAGGCGDDDDRGTAAAEATRTPTATATATPDAAGVESIAGTYRTTLTAGDVPDDANLPPNMIAGDWTITISPTGGVDGAASMKLEHAEEGVFLTPGTPAVDGKRFVNGQQHCWDHNRDEVYDIRATGDELVLGATKDVCPTGEIAAVLTSHPLERVR
jgi:hypothetical protein